MTNIHDQAMNYVYQQVLQRLLSFFSRAERTALQLLIQRLAVAAGGMDRMGDYKVLSVQTGSRDSCYSLALLRAAQLTIASRAPATFKLRVATLRMNGNSPTALENIHRTCCALFVYDDPRVEVVMVDHREVLPFDHLAPLSEDGREANRMNLLMMGHRCTSDGPLELADDGYLATGEFYGQIARWNHGVDALVSGDLPRQQKQFIEGLKRAASIRRTTTSRGIAHCSRCSTLWATTGIRAFIPNKSKYLGVRQSSLKLVAAVHSSAFTTCWSAIWKNVGRC
jgi:hypothetical protein